YEEGHIPGALYLDHERQLAAPKSGRNGRHPLPALQDFSQLMQDHGLKTETQVGIYDASAGMSASHLWWMLRWLGHDKVAVLDGGWQAWVAAGGLVEAVNRSVGVTAAPRQDADGDRQPAMPVVVANTALANLSVPTYTIV